MPDNKRPAQFTVTQNLKTKRFRYLPRFIRQGEKVYECLEQRQQSVPEKFLFVTFNSNGKGPGYLLPKDVLSCDIPAEAAA